MENEAGPRVAYFSHPFPPGRFAQQKHAGTSRHQERNAGWNAESWEWDSVRFVAKPAEEKSQGREGSTVQNAEASSRILQLGTYDSTNMRPENNKRKYSSEEEDEGNLTLKLGGSLYGDDSNSKTSKRFRSGLISSSYPLCQVDDCRKDLTNAKDYHRRHKVCEFHSKASTALVGTVMQRFCQQCSRFHPLGEFDEGKRSCRRRLAGHNKRRRKTQAEEIGCRGFINGDENGASKNVNIASLITVLSQQHQASNSVDKLFGQRSLDKEHLIRCLSKLKSVPSLGDFGTTRPQLTIDLNVSQNMQPQAQEQDAKGKVLQTTDPVLDSEMLRILSTLTERSPEALSLLQRSLMTQKTLNSNNSNNQQTISQQFLDISSALIASRNTDNVAVSDGCENISKSVLSRGNLVWPVHHFNSSDGTRHPNLVVSNQYFAEDSCNPVEGRFSSRSPSASPPVVQKFFPLHSKDKNKEIDSVSVSEEDELTTDQSPKNDGLCKFGLSNSGRMNDLHNIPLSSPPGGSDLKINGYTSSSSDQSPSSSNSDTKERTSRIIFKLFGKDPSDFPQTLRSEILEWLSRCPSDMESYIRPGCVILTIFASMPMNAWEQLRGDLQERMKLLFFKDSRNSFWRNGRMIVQAEQQLALFRDGKIRFCRASSSLDAPEICSVWPIAVVAGEETRLVLKGHNLTTPGTKILCAYRGKCISQNVPEDYQAGCCTLLSNATTIEHKFPGGPANVFGRIFMEVERGLKGNNFPVIVADSAICRELLTLEDDFEGFREGKVTNRHSKLHSRDDVVFGIQEDIVTFLNELGWLFQRNSYFKDGPFSPKCSPARFKFLLIFSVERDWNSLLQKVLDILFRMYGEEEESVPEAFNILSEINLLHRAVKRNCRKAVDMLLCYIPSSSNYRNFAFRPDVIGPGGLTPLHLAASMQNADDIIDALTNDPQKIGLQAWTTALDANQQTPHGYALMRNNHTYNRLVEKKLTDQRRAQVSITISKEPTLNRTAMQGVDRTVGLNIELSQVTLRKLPTSCSKCMRLSSNRVSRLGSYHGLMYPAFVHSLLGIATVCVCVCLLFKTLPTIGSVAPFMWEKIKYGSE